MTTYTDHEQRMLDQQSGAEMDRIVEHLKREGHTVYRVDMTKPESVTDLLRQIDQELAPKD